MRYLLPSPFCILALLGIVAVTSPASAVASAIVEGDAVVVAKTTNLMIGSKVLGIVQAGKPLCVLERQGHWIGVSTKCKGRQVAGWIHLRDLRCEVAPTPSPVPAKSGLSTAKQRVTVEYYEMPTRSANGGYDVKGTGRPIRNHSHHVVPEIHHWTPWGY
jgi:hypothetical protein